MEWNNSDPSYSLRFVDLNTRAPLILSGCDMKKLTLFMVQMLGQTAVKVSQEPISWQSLIR